LSKAQTKTKKRSPRSNAFSREVAARAREHASLYTVVVTIDPRGHYLAKALEIPTAFATGISQETAVANLRDSLHVLVASMIEDGEAPPAPANLSARDEQINIRLTSLERLRLESAARTQGFRGLSDFVRISALNAAS
jgi:predicted RNase H-like HicB family nuclease